MSDPPGLLLPVFRWILLGNQDSAKALSRVERFVWAALGTLVYITIVTVDAMINRELVERAVALLISLNVPSTETTGVLLLLWVCLSFAATVIFATLVSSLAATSPIRPFLYGVLFPSVVLLAAFPNRR